MNRQKSLLIFAVAAFFGMTGTSLAQDPCGVGTRVQMKDGGTGTIAEIGTEHPHVGWYRIVLSWSPGGEWYDARTWEMTIVGTDTKCGKRAAPRAEAKPVAKPDTPPKAKPGPQPAKPQANPEAKKKCMEGSKVQLKDGGTGTIAEIGTEAPHVGWYRIVFSWSPKGEWYDPRTWEMTIVDTDIKCVDNEPAPRPAPAAAPAPPPKHQPAPVPPVVKRPGAPAENAQCPMDVPPGKVTRSSRASEALFKRVIYEKEASKINPDSIQAPKQIGMTFLSFDMGEPYENDLSSTRFGDKRRHDGAPLGAIIYPIKARELKCELNGDQIRRTVKDTKRDCFKNRDDDWICPGGTVKDIEYKLIDIK